MAIDVPHARIKVLVARLQELAKRVTPHESGTNHILLMECQAIQFERECIAQALSAGKKEH